MTTLQELLDDHCQNLQSGAKALPPPEAEALLALTTGWEQNEDGTAIEKRMRFEGFSDAVRFLSRLASIADDQDHHPDVHLIRYRWLTIEFSTHSIGGLSRNDFIMAAKTNELYDAFG